MCFQRYKAFWDRAEKVKSIKSVRPHLRTTPFAHRLLAD